MIKRMFAIGLLSLVSLSAFANDSEFEGFYGLIRKRYSISHEINFKPTEIKAIEREAIEDGFKKCKEAKFKYCALISVDLISCNSWKATPYWEENLCAAEAKFKGFIR